MEAKGALVKSLFIFGKTGSETNGRRNDEISVGVDRGMIVAGCTEFIYAGRSINGWKDEATRIHRKTSTTYCLHGLSSEG